MFENWRAAYSSKHLNISSQNVVRTKRWHMRNSYITSQFSGLDSSVENTKLIHRTAKFSKTVNT